MRGLLLAGFGLMTLMGGIGLVSVLAQEWEGFLEEHWTMWVPLSVVFAIGIPILVIGGSLILVKAL